MIVAFVGLIPTIVAATCSAQSFDKGTEGWTVVTMCYRAGFVAPNDPLLLLPCCPGECPPSQQCEAFVGCGQMSCEPTNPGGFLQMLDPDGSCLAGHVQYWSAPAAVVEQLHLAKGGSLAFKLQSLGSFSFFEQEDVVIDSAATRLVRIAVTSVPASWTTYSVPLTADGWHFDSPSGPLATEQDLASVLARANSLYLRAEYRFGPDTARLDDVQIVSAAIAGDINGDGVVNATDLAVLLGAWGSNNPAADLDGDGIVGASDLAVLLGAWTA